MSLNEKVRIFLCFRSNDIRNELGDAMWQVNKLEQKSSHESFFLSLSFAPALCLDSWDLMEEKCKGFEFSSHIDQAYFLFFEVLKN